MSFDLLLVGTNAPASIATPRERAIYRDALAATGKAQKARNIADLLERGHRSRPARSTALLVDVTA